MRWKKKLGVLFFVEIVTFLFNDVKRTSDSETPLPVLPLCLFWVWSLLTRTPDDGWVKWVRWILKNRIVAIKNPSRKISAKNLFDDQAQEKGTIFSKNGSFVPIHKNDRSELVLISEKTSPAFGVWGLAFRFRKYRDKVSKAFRWGTSLNGLPKC